MTDFDLRAAIRAVLDETDLTSPAEIAAKVAENVPQRQRLAVLVEALTAVVRIEIGHVRRAPSPTASRTPTPKDSARSAKVRAIREAWRTRLRERYHIGSGGWAMLADLTYENVLFLAAERRDMARRNAEAAAWFDTLAEALKERDAERVGDLPDEVLASLLSREVAA